VALAGPDQVAALDPSGREVARIGNANSSAEVPFDKPASTAFVNDRVLVTNQSLFNRDPAHWAVLAVNANESRGPVGTGETGAPLRVSVRPRRVRKGRRVRFTVKVTTRAGLPVRRARVAIGRRRARTGARGIARVRRVRVHRTGRRKVVVRATGYARGRGFYRVVPQPPR
jgi:hypothetical protein